MSVLICPEFFLKRIVESRTVDWSWHNLPVDSRPFYFLHDHVVLVPKGIVVFLWTAVGRLEVVPLPLSSVVA
jgi:hypothetical protein